MSREKEEPVEDKYIEFAHKVCTCEPGAKPGYEPHQHQRETWLALKRMRTPRRGIVALPTGAGKTFTAIHWLATNVLSEPNSRSVLWIAHRAELLQQAAEELYESRGLCKRKKPLEIRCISGVHGKPISTLIANADVTFVTIQSLARRDDLVKKYFEKNPDCVVVVDEAHHVAARSYRRVLGVASKRRKVEIIGLTATPTRTIKDEVADLIKIFPDKIIYQVSLTNLIEKEILARPICKTVKTNHNFDGTFTSKELKHLQIFGDLPPSVLAKIGQSTSRNKLIFNHYIENEKEYGKTLIFATNITHCYSLAETFRKGGVSADYVASKRHDNVSNESIISKYRSGEIKVLVSVEMLTEGFDLPNTKSVLLASVVVQ